MTEKKTFTLRIFRGTSHKQFWEEFELAREEGLNIISALMEIQKNPVTKSGKKVEPVSWEQGCLEEVCGSCSMIINGRPRQACTAIVETILQQTGSSTIALAPFTKFPLVRDLVVNRQRMFNTLKEVHGWVDVDGTFIKGFGPSISPAKQEKMYVLSTCMTCGCCTEACPQYLEDNAFVGAAAISQVRLYNTHPTGREAKSKRLATMMEKGGIAECGNAQNCVQVCPKDIPLTESIAAVGRDVSLEAFRTIFSTPDREK